MSHINIKHDHQLSRDEARQRVEDIAETLKKKLHIQYQWIGDSLEFKRPGAKGSIDLGADFVEVKIKLGMLVVPMKDKIEAQVKEQIQYYLA